jgi:hypothetical protein
VRRTPCTTLPAVRRIPPQQAAGPDGRPATEQREKPAFSSPKRRRTCRDGEGPYRQAAGSGCRHCLTLLAAGSNQAGESVPHRQGKTLVGVTHTKPGTSWNSQASSTPQPLGRAPRMDKCGPRVHCISKLHVPRASLNRMRTSKKGCCFSRHQGASNRAGRRKQAGSIPHASGTRLQRPLPSRKIRSDNGIRDTPRHSPRPPAHRQRSMAGGGKTRAVRSTATTGRTAGCELAS